MEKKLLLTLMIGMLVGATFYGPQEGLAMTEKSEKQDTSKRGEQSQSSSISAEQKLGQPWLPLGKRKYEPGQCSLPLDDTALKKLLTPEQYAVMRKNGTEAPFRNEYWNNKKPGIYVDRITGEALFSSAEKFDSGTGWPSFFRPIEKDAVIEKPDATEGMSRTEVRSKKSNSHLGHVFPDGPKPTGLRYCINSASLRFIPVENFEKEGYGQYLALFPEYAKTLSKTKSETATFAAGCFWGVEYAFRKVPGVLKTTAGYTGGLVKNPTYEQVCSHTTGHAEAVQVEFDPSKVSYEKLLETFWSIHDPTTVNRQGPDTGSNYRSAVFYNSPEQKKTAETLKNKLDHSGKFTRPIVTEITPAKEFYKAEDYHQQYFEKRGMRPHCSLPHSISD